MFSIRFKITAITIVEILTAILCVSLASFSIIQTENDQRSVEMMELVARDTRKSLEKYTESVESSVETVSNLANDMLDSVALIRGGVGGANALAERTPEQTAQLNAYLEGHVEQIRGDFATVAGHSLGVVSYYYCLTSDVSAMVHGFSYSRVGKTGFEERDPIDVRSLDPSDLTHAMWYFIPIQRGRPSWVGPYESSVDKMQICSYVVPVYKSGTLVGVIGMDIPLQTLVTLVSGITVYETGFASLLDSSGHVLYHPNMGAGNVLDLPVDREVMRLDDSGGALIRYTSKGREYQMSFTTLSNGMKLAVVAPTTEVNAASIRLVRVVPPITVTILILFTVLTLLLMRFITRPLQRLTAASQRLAAAEYDVELDYKGKDEVGALTSAFKRMRDQLKESIADLNVRVHTDDLTGLPNQRYFYELAADEERRLLKLGLQPVVLYFNLLGMKHFNRQYGFEEGDRLIREVAAILAHHFGELNTSRFSQDHFVAICDDEGLEKKLLEVFKDCQSANGGKSLPVSVGIYHSSLESVNMSVACDRAKFACDRRRGSFFSGFRYFDIGMLKSVDLIRHVINHVDEAIDKRQIEVYYQPIVRAVNGRVCDEEALSRWNDPVQGFLSPVHFIPALENAGLIYKLDLYVLDRVLEKIHDMRENGYDVAPHSINLSRSDFDTCDIVEEIRTRVDAAGIERRMITIEITESIIGSDFEFMKMQVERFQSLGFPVWMDDFGSGYSSLEVLQSIKFDLIKFDMGFMRKLDESDDGRIILTELMQMATALGVDTVCEGVETEGQVRFLREIGCSKLQGYYFCRPIPLKAIIDRYERGIQIGYEDSDQSDYYEAIGRVNLHDLAVIARDEEGSFQKNFNTLPMAIMEVRSIGEERVEFVRTNQSYRDFIWRNFGLDLAVLEFDPSGSPLDMEPFFVKLAHACIENDGRALVDEWVPNGSLVHFLAKHISTNEVTGTEAIAVVVLSIGNPNEGATYANIARVLAVDYYSIYFVDMKTEDFIEYGSSGDGDDVVMERHGTNFFAACQRDVMTRIFAQDQAYFLQVFTKKNIVRELEVHGVFTAGFRLVEHDVPVAATLRVTRMDPNGRYIIVGISLEDA